MNEEVFREAMRRAASGEPAAGDAYARFLARRARGARLRGMVVFIAGAAAVATLFLVLPGPFNQGPPTNFSAPGATTEPVGNVRRFIDPTAGFQLEYPGNWLARGRSGEYAEFYPPNGKQDNTGAVLFDTEYCTDCGGSAFDPATRTFDATAIQHPLRFYVRIIEKRAPTKAGVSGLKEDLLRLIRLQRAAGARATDSSFNMGGIETIRFDAVFPAEPAKSSIQDPARPERPVGPDEWCSACRMAEYVLSVNDWQFAVRIVAPDDVTWNTYAAEATRLAETFSSYSPSAQPTAYP